MLLQETYKISRQAMESLVHMLRHPDWEQIHRANECLERNGFKMQTVKTTCDTVSVEFDGLDLSFLDEEMKEPVKYIMPSMEKSMEKIVSSCKSKMNFSDSCKQYASFDDVWIAA